MDQAGVVRRAVVIVLCVVSLVYADSFIGSEVAWYGGTTRCSFVNASCPGDSGFYFANYAGSEESVVNKMGRFNNGTSSFENVLTADDNYIITGVTLTIYGHLNCYPLNYTSNMENTTEKTYNYYQITLQDTKFPLLQVERSRDCSPFFTASTQPSTLCINCFSEYNLASTQYVDGWPNYNYTLESRNYFQISNVNHLQNITEVPPFILSKFIIIFTAASADQSFFEKYEKWILLAVIVAVILTIYPVLCLFCIWKNRQRTRKIMEDRGEYAVLVENDEENGDVIYETDFTNAENDVAMDNIQSPTHQPLRVASPINYNSSNYPNKQAKEGVSVSEVQNNSGNGNSGNNNNNNNNNQVAVSSNLIDELSAEDRELQQQQMLSNYNNYTGTNTIDSNNITDNSVWSEMGGHQAKKLLEEAFPSLLLDSTTINTPTSPRNPNPPLSAIPPNMQNSPAMVHSPDTGVLSPLPSGLSLEESAPSLSASSSASQLVWTMNKEIRPEEISIGSIIGRGSFGDVFLGTWEGTTVAIKRLPTAVLSSNNSSLLQSQIEETITTFLREAMILRSLRHPHILQLLATYMDPPDICIVTEYMPRGSLYSLLHTYKGELPWRIIRKILIGACRGMSYLHNSTPRIIHRDLKSQNLLIDEGWKCKICDFGLAKMGEARERGMTSCGTPEWTAPEVLRGETYAEKADVFSFGIVMWEAMTRKELYEGLEQTVVIIKVGTQGLRPEIPAGIESGDEVRKLMEECWAEEPERRPGFVDIIKSLIEIRSVEKSVWRRWRGLGEEEGNEEEKVEDENEEYA